VCPGPEEVVVKLDVEGHEFPALQAIAGWSGWSQVVALWIEFSSATDRDACEALLSGAGFAERHRVGTPYHYDALYVRPEVSLPQRLRLRGGETGAATPRSRTLGDPHPSDHGELVERREA